MYRIDTNDTVSSFATNGDYFFCGEGQALVIRKCNDGAIVRSLRGHDDSIAALSFFGDHRVISSGLDNRIGVFDIKENSSVFLKGHTQPAGALDSSKSMARFVSGDASGKVILWSSKDFKRLSEYQLGHPIRYLGLVSEKEVLIVYNIYDVDAITGVIEIIDLKNGSGKKKKTIQSKIECASMIPGGKEVALGRSNGELLLLDCQSLEERFRLRISTNRISAVAPASVLPILFVGSNDGTITTVDIKSKKAISSRKDRDAYITSLLINNDHLLASADAKGSIIVYSLKRR